MEWAIKLFNWVFRRSASEREANEKEFRAITSEWRALKNEYQGIVEQQKQEIDQYKAKIDKMEKDQITSQRQISELLRIERGLQKEMISLREDNRNMREEILFLKNLK